MRPTPRDPAHTFATTEDSAPPLTQLAGRDHVRLALMLDSSPGIALRHDVLPPDVRPRVPGNSARRLVYCAGGFRAGTATSLLDRAGVDAVHVDDAFTRAVELGVG
jgi:rhodanese-related sulfurtransferase